MIDVPYLGRGQKPRQLLRKTCATSVISNQYPPRAVSWYQKGILFSLRRALQKVAAPLAKRKRRVAHGGFGLRSLLPATAAEKAGLAKWNARSRSDGRKRCVSDLEKTTGPAIKIRLEMGNEDVWENNNITIGLRWHLPASPSLIVYRV